MERGETLRRGGSFNTLSNLRYEKISQVIKSLNSMILLE
jgi:hypothetical protein